MGKRVFPLKSLGLVASAFLLSCNSQPITDADAQDKNPRSNQGSLTLVANGEDFVRQGFISKDGWQIQFNHVYVTLNQVVAYQTETPFNSEQNRKIQTKEKVILLNNPKTIDLAEGDLDADPIVVAEVKAPPGIYNALSWKLAKAEEGPAETQTILFQGIASKNGQTVDFLIGFNQKLEYVCGEFVGEGRKGILQEKAKAELETTFHFDHIFGNGQLAADDDLNSGALGFAPLAALAKNGRLEIDLPTLKQRLTPEKYHLLETAILGLGHVGEGHCQEIS